MKKNVMPTCETETLALNQTLMEVAESETQRHPFHEF